MTHNQWSKWFQWFQTQVQLVITGGGVPPIPGWCLPWNRRTATSRRSRSQEPAAMLEPPITTYTSSTSTDKDHHHRHLSSSLVIIIAVILRSSPTSSLKEGSTSGRYTLAQALQHQARVQAYPPVGRRSPRSHLQECRKSLQVRSFQCVPTLALWVSGCEVGCGPAMF